MCLYLGGCGCTPHVCTPPCTFVYPLYIHMPPIHLYAPRGVYPPGAPMLSVLLHGFGTLHVVGGCFSVLYVLGHTTPIWGCLPLNYTPHTPLLVPCALLFSGISVLLWDFPLLLKGLGVFPHHLGRFWGDTSALQLFTCSFCYTFFVVHYVSRLNHSSDYYSSNYSGIFWPVISVISISDSFSDRFSSKP